MLCTKCLNSKLIMGQKDMIHVSYPNYESYIVSMMQSDMELHHFWFSECVILRFQSL